MEPDDSILTRLASGDVDVRRVALTEIDEVLDVASCSDLLPLLTDEDPTVRKLAIQVSKRSATLVRFQTC
jgi:hypothetical protein